MFGLSILVSVTYVGYEEIAICMSNQSMPMEQTGGIAAMPMNPM
jgi:hypothetical protein